MRTKNYILSLLGIATLGLSGAYASSPKISASKLKDMMTMLSNDIKNPVLTSKSCHTRLSSHYNSFFNLTSNRMETSTFSKSALDELIDLSFKSRLELKEKLKRLRKINTDNDEKCLTAVRDIIRTLRYLEDYLIEFHVGINHSASNSYTTLKGGFPELLTNPDYNFSGVDDLESGDVILSRGNAFTSAAIARIGSVDTQFSHLTFVYEDKECSVASGKKCLFTTEAHIEIGSVVAPIQTHIDQGNSRTVVFRMKDADLAHEAAKYMYEKVKSSDKNIQYDFAMNYKSPDRLFCSEVIYDGFYTVSNKSVDVPENKMKFPKGLIPFLNQMGIKVNKSNINSFETFAPGDIEYDSRFELVAEWRNPHKLADTRIKDVVLTSMFNWMENYGYRFKVPFFTHFGSRAAWVARRLPIVNNILKDKIPVNMTKSQMNLFVTLDQIGIKLENKIKSMVSVDKASPLTPKDMFSILETFRQNDMDTYLHPGRLVKVGSKFLRRRKLKSIFHGVFRASRSKMLKLKKSE